MEERDTTKSRGDLAWAARYASLGESIRSRIGLMLFGFLARGKRRPSRLLRRWFEKRKAFIHVSPKRMEGRAVWVDPLNRGTRVIFEEFFFDGSYLLDKIPFIPDHILDCGAHIGLFSILASNKYPLARLIAFEPNPEHFAILRRQFAGREATVDLRQAAVSNKRGVAQFARYSDCNGRLTEDAAAGALFQVQVLDLSIIIRKLVSNGLLLKVDIEGEEHNLFPAIVPALPRKCAIFFETHLGVERWMEAKELLEIAGFTVQQLNFREGCADGFALRLQ